MIARVGLAVAAVLVAAACSTGAPTPSATHGIVELAIRTAPGDGCPDALMPDVSLDVDLNARDPLTAVGATGARIALVFPGGTRAAVHLDRNAVEILLPGGERAVVGIGERISFGGGQFGAEGDDTFFACSIVE